MSTRRRSLQRAFTLVELLVVVSIIALLIAILMPSLRCARKQAKNIQCMANIRSLGMGAVTYASDWYVYPPSLSNYAVTQGLNSNAGGLDWLGVGDQFGPYVPGSNPNDPQSGNPKGFLASPYHGALWPYVKQEKAYLCPEDPPGLYDSSSITGGGGNGRFSYTMFDMLGLRPPERIPARFQDQEQGPRGPVGPQKRKSKRAQARTPLFVEEHPLGINAVFRPSGSSETGHMEGNFNFGTDYVVSRHGPFAKRVGYPPRGGGPSLFEQGTTNIGFADGHVEAVKVNYGFGKSHVQPGAEGEGGVSYTAAGLLYYYGVCSDVDECELIIKIAE
ncbi:MAG: prepilin-type N-terminal cleavage/methylation domain-containing protein [Planctomycetes bacterium]|nr:prepilin-type N-terminal cleavage/methylation domain-containing protein [Planctomycetota bacterium]